MHLRIGQLPSVAEVDNTGVGDNDIKATKGLPCLFKQCLHIIFRADIGAHRQRFGTGGFDFGNGLLKDLACGVLHICKNHIKTILGKFQRVGLTLTHSAAGNKYNFTIHSSFLLLGFVIFSANPI